MASARTTRRLLSLLAYTGGASRCSNQARPLPALRLRTLQVPPDAVHPVVVQVQALEALQLGEPLQPHDGVVRQVDGVELVLQQRRRRSGRWPRHTPLRGAAHRPC